MYHSITFGDKNTWDDWHLIPKTRPLFNPPSVKTYVIDIPGGNGSLDLTESLTGYPTYKNRTGSWDFYVQNGFKDWATLYSEIMEYLHGQRMRVVLEDDPEYYYEGRFAVNTWKSDSYWSTISIDYDVNPYKRHYLPAGDDWLWDTFSFEDGEIRSYDMLPVDGTLTLTIEGGIMPAPPIIIASAEGMSVSMNGNTYALEKGTNYIAELAIQKGQNALTFTGTGSITVKYERGRL